VHDLSCSDVFKKFEFSGVNGITPHSLISSTLMVTDVTTSVVVLKELECLGVKGDISLSLTVIGIYKLI